MEMPLKQRNFVRQAFEMPEAPMDAIDRLTVCRPMQCPRRIPHSICVKTQIGRAQMGIVFPRPIEFERSWEHSPRHSRSGGRLFYVLLALRRFYTAKTHSRSGVSLVSIMGRQLLGIGAP